MFTKKSHGNARRGATVKLLESNQSMTRHCPRNMRFLNQFFIGNYRPGERKNNAKVLLFTFKCKRLFEYR